MRFCYIIAHIKVIVYAPCKRKAFCFSRVSFLRHEIMERELMRKGYSQDEAHRITSKKYNYRKEAEAYYDSLEKHKKESK